MSLPIGIGVNMDNVLNNISHMRGNNEAGIRGYDPSINVTEVTHYNDVDDIDK